MSEQAKKDLTLKHGRCWRQGPGDLWHRKGGGAKIKGQRATRNISFSGAAIWRTKMCSCRKQFSILGLSFSCYNLTSEQKQQLSHFLGQSLETAVIATWRRDFFYRETLLAGCSPKWRRRCSSCRRTRGRRGASWRSCAGRGGSESRWRWCFLWMTRRWLHSLIMEWNGKRSVLAWVILLHELRMSFPFYSRLRPLI